MVEKYGNTMNIFDYLGKMDFGRNTANQRLEEVFNLLKLTLGGQYVG